MAKKTLKQENADLKKQIAALKKQLKPSTTSTEAWEDELKELVKENPEDVVKFMSNIGLPHNYDGTNLYEVAHTRARANGGEQWVEQLKNFLD